MSIEEKAKRYDEAIEKAKSWYQDSQIDFKKSLENLFPELKGSDDESDRITNGRYIKLIVGNRSLYMFKDGTSARIKYIDEKCHLFCSTWSEEDEKMLDNAIGAIGAADYYTYDDKQEIENWLKSLKQRIKL